ncbi:hypothetical protein BGZ96_001319 [Linnemannia gamsii]|uniref:Uncharacterized protein n=1 Tax=Linnemannia gamsii TaxID=64522 RepID=A0ABQ7JNL3_9FUNG|nr:hypothetical protein BGZ96_001319 [Linnemannia gamsii]
MSTRNDTGADGKTPAAPPPSPFRFFLSQQADSDSVVAPFNEMLIGNNTNRSRNNMYSPYRNNITTNPPLGKAYLRTRCCCSPKTLTTSCTAAAIATATAVQPSSSSASSGINNGGAASFCSLATCITCHRPSFATQSVWSTVYPSPELSDLDDDDIAALEGIVLDVDNSCSSHKRRRPSLDLRQNRIKRFRSSPPPRRSQATYNHSDSDDLTVVSDTVTDDTVSSSPAPSNPAFTSPTSDFIGPIVVNSPPYHPADVFPDSNSGWHEQIVEYDWASSTDEDERKTAFSDSSYWSGIDCRDETFSDLETRFSLDGMDSPPYQPQDYNEMNPAMDPQETRWFEQQLTTLSSGSRRRREDSPPYVPFDYNTLSSEMDPNEGRFFEQPRAKYISAVADEDCSDSASCDGDVSSNDMAISDDDMSLSDDDF